MARNSSRLRQSRRSARLDFAGIEIIGALLTPDMVAKIATFEANDQTEESYGIEPGLKLRDEIARYYRIGEALWAKFSASRRQNVNASSQFVAELLKKCFGFDAVAPQPIVRLGAREFPVPYAAFDGHVPIVIAPASADGSRKAGVDESLAQFADGTRRRSATLLLQEYLNAQDSILWGLASDGLVLRLMRDNISLTRPAWIEFDIAKIFSDGLFFDFSALWLLIHQSRFGDPGKSPSDCALERWRDRGRVEGVAARDKLRQGVESALLELGQGFVENRANDALRQALTEGKLTQQVYFEELLRLIYRLIFLFAAEDRDLLHPTDAIEAVRKTYAQGYSLNRLRERCMRRVAWDRNVDVWEGLKATFAALSRGEPRLGLPALGGLFSHGQMPTLTDAKIENRRFLAAIWRLAWLRPEGQPLTRVNWRDMETEELGSVYESLLELTPRANAVTRSFDFAEGLETKGNARKTSGSYYTPDSLVKLLLDSTLDPVLDDAEARNPADPASEILKLSIIDPACGSGHFLLGAARRAAARIAKLRSPGAPSQMEFQHALREVVSHCIYGVDRNPMAVELCKVALWIEALEPGKPLSFLDARIRCGDSLVGVFDLEMLRKGIPDEAFKALTGDVKEIAKAYTKHNKEQRDGQGATGFLSDLRPPADLIDAARALVDMPENSLEEISAKRKAFEHLHTGQNWLNLKTACDLFVAAFFIPKTGPVPGPGERARPIMPLTEHVWKAARGESIYGPLVGIASDAAHKVSALHWHLEFPHVFARGGFDVVVGNPPWEVSQLDEQEYFAAKLPEIAALSGDDRKKAIACLGVNSPRIWEQFIFDKQIHEAVNEFFRTSGRYGLTAVGKINTYALFAEHFANLACPEGRSGIIVPTGIATDSSTSAFFGNLVEKGRLARLIDFENREKLFPAVDSRMKFCLLTIGNSDEAEFSFFLTNSSHFEEAERRFTLTAEQIAHINPNTKTAPVFRSRKDAELAAKFYVQAPVLIQERANNAGGDINPWGVSFQQGLFNMTSASELFRSERQLIVDGWTRDMSDWLKEIDGNICRYVPLYEAKMIHHFDHRWATYAGASSEDEEGARDSTLAEKQDVNFEPQPRYWVPVDEVQFRAARVPAGLKRAWRENSTERCLKGLAEWLAGYFHVHEGRPMREDDLVRILGRDRPWRAALGKTTDRWLLEPKTIANGVEAQTETPLNSDDVDFLHEGIGDALSLVSSIINRKQPRWLMGWRDITNATNERTVIASVFPKVGVGHNMPLFYMNVPAKMAAVSLALWTSMAFDFVARLSVGGTHLTYSYLKQLAVLPPSSFADADINFVVPRILELTYTSYALRPWAEDLGYTGQPFIWDENRRAILRGELDAFFGKKYGLSKEEMQYILDPAKAKGPDYPSETFRVLKTKEEARYGEFRTEKLVLEAWDRIAGMAAETQKVPLPATAPAKAPAPVVPNVSALHDGAWERVGAALDQHTGTGLALAAILKTMAKPVPARQVRLAAIFVLEPRLLLPYLTNTEAATWRRLVGNEAEPLSAGTSSLVARTNQHWATAVGFATENGILLEEAAQPNTWSSGTNIDTIRTPEWASGRAWMIVGVLERKGIDDIVRNLPDDATRGWVNAEAA